MRRTFKYNRVDYTMMVVLAFSFIFLLVLS